MAAKELELKLMWENGVNFKLTAKQDGGAVLTIVSLDENGHIRDLWPYAQALAEKFFEAELIQIGTEMKQ